MALIGISLLVASVVFFCLRPPAWLPKFLTSLQQGRTAPPPAPPSIKTISQDEDGDTEEAEKAEGNGVQEDVETAELRTIPGKKEQDAAAMPPPPLPVIRMSLEEDGTAEEDEGLRKYVEILKHAEPDKKQDATAMPSPSSPVIRPPHSSGAKDKPKPAIQKPNGFAAKELERKDEEVDLKMERDAVSMPPPPPLVIHQPIAIAAEDEPEPEPVIYQQSVNVTKKVEPEHEEPYFQIRQKRTAMLPLPQPVIRQPNGNATKQDDPEEEEQSTPKASVTKREDDHVPSFSLSEPETSPSPTPIIIPVPISTPAPTSNPAPPPPPVAKTPSRKTPSPSRIPPPRLNPSASILSLMAPPPVPRPSSIPRLSPTSPGAMAPPPSLRGPSRGPSPSASSPTPNRSRTLPIPNRGPAAGGMSSLALPPTHSVKPKKPSKQVNLTPGHSPMDWARLANSPTSDLRNLPPKTPYLKVTPSMLKKMTGRKGKDAWCALGGKVYNITPYAPFHPGGEPELLRGAGRDGTKLFGEIHPWVNYETMLSACLIGIMVDEHDTGNTMDEMD